MKDSVYHRLLRISALTLAIVLLFDSGILFPETHNLSLNTQHYLAKVIGVQASVEPTELNMLTAELTKREQDLVRREQALKEREISVSLDEDPADTHSDNYSTYIMSILLLILLILIVTNYILDYFRMLDARRLIQQNERVT